MSVVFQQTKGFLTLKVYSQGKWIKKGRQVVMDLASDRDDDEKKGKQ